MKLSRKAASQLVYEYAAQVLFYAYGASILLSQPVDVGGLILPGIYGQKQHAANSEPQGVFAEFPYTMTNFDVILSSVLDEIARIRKGVIRLTTSDSCSYCPSGGLQRCKRIHKTQLSKLHNG